jgi:membrane-associated protease RseP (regulator of RpoE activity)
MKTPCLVLFEILTLTLAGCASAPKTPVPKPEHQQGWMGGSYERAKAHFDWFRGDSDTIYCFPTNVAPAQKAGILITQLDTNTPAARAGLRAGDLILELGHQTVTDLPAFRRIVTETQPGAALPVKGWREGNTLECTVIAGREKYQYQGNLSVGLPGFWESLRLIPTRNAPGLSLGPVGYHQDDNEPVEFASVEERFRRACHPQDKQEGYDEDWKFWLAIVKVSKGKKILAQEPVVVEKASVGAVAPPP